jgi:hypothetical protein
MADAHSDEGEALGTNTQLTALFIKHFRPVSCFISCNWTCIERVPAGLYNLTPHTLKKHERKEGRKKDWRKKRKKERKICIIN